MIAGKGIGNDVGYMDGIQGVFRCGEDKLRRLMVWAIPFLALAGLAYLVAGIWPPAGWQFLGGIASPDDVSVYLAAMYQGTRGAWLYRSPFDPTSPPALLMYLPYLGLGHLARLLHVEPLLVYHVSRLLGAVGALVVAFGWARMLFQEKKARTLAWMLVTFSAGMGWLLAFVPDARWQAHLIDLRLPETSTFLSAFTAPHFVAGVALEAWALLLFWQALQKPGRWGHVVLCGLSLLGLGLVYPFTLAVVYAVVGLYALWMLVRGERQRKKWIVVATLVVFVIPAPFVLYYVRTFFFDPFWKGTHVLQNVIPTPGIGWLIAGYGLPLGLAVWGAVGVFRSRDERFVLVGLWALVNAALLFAPVTFQWRLANGWHFALALLAARGVERGLLPWAVRHGWLAWLRRLSPAPLDTLRRVVVILAVPSTLMVSLIGVRIALTERGFPYYFPSDELAAMEGLSSQLTFDDVVLGAYQTGNVLPTRAFCRVVVGQQFATLDPMKKLADVTRFFQAETSDEERRAILERYGVTVVYYGRWERALGGFEPGACDDLIEVASSGETVLYRVQLLR